MGAAWFRRNWFVVGIVAALSAGVLFSEFGVRINPGGVANRVIIVVIFLVSGFRLPTETISSGLKGVKLHVVLQVFIFIIVPALVYFVITPFHGWFDPSIVLGIYALSVLPTTTSSCIVFIQRSGGNTFGGMFNSALANTIGVFVSPLLLSVILQQTGQAIPPEELLVILRNLALTMLLPIVVGQLARQFAHEFAARRKGALADLGGVLILCVVYLAFSRAAANPEFAQNLGRLAFPFVFLAAAHWLLLAAAYLVGRAFAFGAADRITIMFAAPQKTLPMGVPLLSAYFQDRPEVLGLALLPLIFYHSFQLFSAGILTSLPFMRRLVASARQAERAAGRARPPVAAAPHQEDHRDRSPTGTVSRR